MFVIYYSLIFILYSILVVTIHNLTLWTKNIQLTGKFVFLSSSICFALCQAVVIFVIYLRNDLSWGFSKITAVELNLLAYYGLICAATLLFFTIWIACYYSFHKTAIKVLVSAHFVLLCITCMPPFYIFYCYRGKRIFLRLKKVQRFLEFQSIKLGINVKSRSFMLNVLTK